VTVHVPAPRVERAGDAYEAYVAPSGARFDYQGPRVLSVHGQATALDQVCFVRHVARQAVDCVRVCGIRMGGSK
jgi:hypothetical protein